MSIFIDKQAAIRQLKTKGGCRVSSINAYIFYAHNDLRMIFKCSYASKGIVSFIVLALILVIIWPNTVVTVSSRDDILEE